MFCQSQVYCAGEVGGRTEPRHYHNHHHIMQKPIKTITPRRFLPELSPSWSSSPSLFLFLVINFFLFSLVPTAKAQQSGGKYILCSILTISFRLVVKLFMNTSQWGNVIYEWPFDYAVCIGFLYTSICVMAHAYYADVSFPFTKLYLWKCSIIELSRHILSSALLRCVCWSSQLVPLCILLLS